MADTGEGRGKSPAACREIFKEMGWDPDLPSNCFAGSSRHARNRYEKKGMK